MNRRKFFKRMGILAGGGFALVALGVPALPKSKPVIAWASIHSAGHGFSVGESVTLARVNGIDGTFKIMSVTQHSFLLGAEA